VIRLDKPAIDHALPLVAVGLGKYCRLQAVLATKGVDVSRDRGFQTAFNGFYRVRRGAEWQFAFYSLLEQQRSAPTSFAGVLRALYNATGSIEASFASKLVASVDPGKPVIDSFVLKNLDLKLARYGAVEPRLARAVELHEHIAREFVSFLSTEMGRYLTARFEECYPTQGVTSVKMLDLVLWKTRRAAERFAAADRPRDSR
jgi:hypothetical protein